MPKSKIWRLIPVFLWMGVIFWFSSQPHLPRYPHGLINLLLRKGAHIVEYGILAALLRWALGVSFQDPVGKGIPFILATLYALSDEFHQSFVPGRNASFLDVGFDTLGASLGLITLWWFSRRGRLSLRRGGPAER